MATCTGQALDIAGRVWMFFHGVTIARSAQCTPNKLVFRRAKGMDRGMLSACGSCHYYRMMASLRHATLGATGNPIVSKGLGG
mmetsp:Transcript_105213/g.177805  ORF Transcript_105213/g.177805 Transcript_105213/m.177805 type:complete len:83 (+) Transcript_105213:325-573(+)